MRELALCRRPGFGDTPWGATEGWRPWRGGCADLTWRGCALARVAGQGSCAGRWGIALSPVCSGGLLVYSLIIFFRALWVRAGSRDCHFALVSGPPARRSRCCATDAGVRQLAIHVRHGCSIHAQRTSGVAIRDDHAVTCAAGAMLCATQAAAATTTPGRQDEMVEEKRGLVSTKDQQTRTRAPRTMSRRDPNQKREERKKEDL